MADWELNLKYPDAIALRRLIDAHPQVFRGELPRVHSHLPPGWYSIVDRLMTDIETLLGTELEGFRIEQIKEKFATLRVYYSRRGRIQLTVDIMSATQRTRLRERASDDIGVRLDELIEAAAAASARTCDMCGAPGQLRGGGWLRTRCDEHAKGRDAELDEDA